MKTWHVYLLIAACVWMLCDQKVSAGSCCCYGPASTPDPQSCQCRMLYDEEVQGYYKEFSASEPVRSANTPQPQFTVYPLGGTFVHGVKVTLFCNVSYNTPDQAAPFTVMWEHNGTTVDPSSGLVQSGTAVKQAGSAVYYSTLTISRFSESAQGDYVCRVGNGNYTIVSPVATLQLPKFLGWVDEVYQNQAHDDIITLSVQKGGSVILECSPNTTESLEGLTPTWVPQNKTSVNLSCGSVLMTNVQEDANLVCFWILRQNVVRQFYVKVTAAPDPTMQDLKLVVSPRDQVAVVGSSVELYCIAESSSPASTLWFKDGQRVESGSIVADGQVLEIHEASASATGNYTCSVSDGHTSVTASATITVVEPSGRATLSVSGSGVTVTGSDAIIPPSTVSLSLSFHCHVENSQAVSYLWMSNGVVIGSGYERDTLNLTTSEPGNVIGSYQCVASNVAGQVSSTAIRVLITKPYPPTNVRVRKNTTPRTYFQYDISWDQPEHAWDYSVTNYTVETIAISSDQRKANFCSCETPGPDGETETMFPFLAGCPGCHIMFTHQLHYRVAANTDSAGQSDFTHGEGPIHITAAPPKAKDLRVSPKGVNEASHTWDVTLSWAYQDTDAYSSHCYDTDVILPCGTTVKHTDTTIQALVNCCTETCEWTVTNNNLFFSNSSVTKSSLRTGEIRPSTPPHLISVARLGTNGTSFSVSFKLPEDPTASCTCNSSSVRVTVNITNATSVHQASTSVPLSLSTTTFTIDLPGAHCSSAYNVSLAFGNSVGMSDFSDPLPIGAPSAGNIPLFFKLRVTTDMEDVIVHYELQPGAVCFLSDGLLQSQICYKISTQEEECSAAAVNSSNAHCSSIVTEKGNITLPRYHTYCVVADLSSDVLDLNESSQFLVIHANEGIPTSKPRDLVALIRNNSLKIQWDAPPAEAWNGIPDSFSMNISVDGRLVNSTRVPVHAQSHYETIFPSKKSGVNYNVTVSSCTSVGCGPIAVKTTAKTEPAGGTSHSSSNSGVNTLVVLVSSLTTGVAVLSLSVVTVVAIACLCYHRKRKKPDSYEELSSESEAEFLPFPISVDDGECRPLPDGDPARSVCTDLESLIRAKEWVDEQPLGGQQHDGRDGYVRDANVELEHMENGQDKDTSQSTDTTTQSSLLVLPFMGPEKKSDYCSESDALLHSCTNLSGKASEKTSGAVLTSAVSPKNKFASASSSGYSTEQSIAKLQTDTSPTSPTQRSVHVHCGSSQAATATHTNTPSYQQPMNQTTPSRPGYHVQPKVERDPTDWMSQLLCTEEFNTPNQSACGDTTLNPLLPTTSSAVIPELGPAPTISPYILSSCDRPGKTATTPPATTPTTSNMHPMELAEGEEGETDSVFDNSILPLSLPETENTQRRTRSSITSGFASLSDTSVDSVPSDNVEMTAFNTTHPSLFAQRTSITSSHTHCAVPLKSRETCPPTSRTLPVPSLLATASTTYVIPSCLPLQRPRNSYTDTLPEDVTPSYVNLEGQLLDDNIIFDLPTCS